MTIENPIRKKLFNVANTCRNNRGNIQLRQDGSYLSIYEKNDLINAKDIFIEILTKLTMDRILLSEKDFRLSKNILHDDIRTIMNIIERNTGIYME